MMPTANGLQEPCRTNNRASGEQVHESLSFPPLCSTHLNLVLSTAEPSVLIVSMVLPSNRRVSLPEHLDSTSSSKGIMRSKILKGGGESRQGYTWLAGAMRQLPTYGLNWSGHMSAKTPIAFMA